VTEIAKVLSVSQPTVSRAIKKLEKEGYLGRYTLIPDFGKLGYKILAITFVKVSGTITPEERERARELAKEVLKKGPFEIVMGERGMGLGYDGVFMSYHKNYGEYTKLLNWFKQFEFLELDKIESFLIDLQDNIHYRPLDFSPLAYHLVMEKENEE
jgi:DNA-binding Lrp family transcriptional regulator